MKYKIEITEISDVEIVEKVWQKLRDVPEDLKRKPGYFDNSEKLEIKEYGYVPVEKRSRSERVIYTQESDTINLTQVIKAVNGI